VREELALHEGDHLGSGNDSGSGYFPISDAEFDVLPDGTWEYTDTLGDYLPGVIFGRKYSIASAPKTAIDELLSRRGEWSEDGIRSLPSSIEKLASFSVPPGEPNAAASCR
jgi:hypothetical protein